MQKSDLEGGVVNLKRKAIGSRPAFADAVGQSLWRRTKLRRTSNRQSAIIYSLLHYYLEGNNFDIHLGPINAY